MNRFLIGYTALLCACGIVILLLGINRNALQYKPIRVFRNLLISSAVMFTANGLSFILREFPAVFLLAEAVYFTALYSMKYLYTSYLVQTISKVEKVSPLVLRGAVCLCFISVFFWAGEFFNGQIHMLGRGHVYQNVNIIAEQCSGLLIIAADVLLLLKHRRAVGTRQMLILISVPTVPMAAVLLQLLTGFDMPVRSYALFLSMLAVYSLHHVDIVRRLEHMEEIILRNRVDMMIARIRPHYLYNVLTTIYYLCEEDLVKAQRAVEVFSEYLRDVLDALKEHKQMPLSWELKTTREYLTLEQIRFGDRLSVTEDIDVDPEMVYLSALSLQPLVENAVRHGISDSHAHVTVHISAEENPDGSISISVQDDGSGYQPDQVKYGEGIINVRERLWIQCAGRLEISSVPGKGTAAVITLPKGGGESPQEEIWKRIFLQK